MDGRSLAAIMTAAAGTTSIAATAVIRVAPTDDSRSQEVGTWMLAEPLVLAALVFVVVRWSSPRAAAMSGSLAGIGSALWVQRFLSGEPPIGEPAMDAVAASAAWLVPSLAAGMTAWYLRWTVAERARAVTTAKAEQRLRLAVDLHDFVAHDISEVVARAQAGAAVLPLGDPRVAELLGQIEAAGLRALESLDQTVHAIGDEDPVRITRGGIDDIEGLVRRFAAAGDVGTVVERALTRTVPSTVGAEAYRAVVEALTNVRRHAVRATTVNVILSEADSQLVVSIADDGEGDGRAGSARRVGPGLGLATMTERVQRQGGSVEAGPRGPKGWRVTVALPLTRTAEQGATL